MVRGTCSHEVLTTPLGTQHSNWGKEEKNEHSIYKANNTVSIHATTTCSQKGLMSPPTYSPHMEKKKGNEHSFQNWTTLLTCMPPQKNKKLTCTDFSSQPMWLLQKPFQYHLTKYLLLVLPSLLEILQINLTVSNEGQGRQGVVQATSQAPLNKINVNSPLLSQWKFLCCSPDSLMVVSINDPSPHVLLPVSTKRIPGSSTLSVLCVLGYGRCQWIWCFRYC